LRNGRVRVLYEIGPNVSMRTRREEIQPTANASLLAPIAEWPPPDELLCAVNYRRHFSHREHIYVTKKYPFAQVFFSFG
jgi:hypothetical protein